MQKIIVERCSRISATSRGWIDGQIDRRPPAAEPDARSASGAGFGRPATTAPAGAASARRPLPPREGSLKNVPVPEDMSPDRAAPAPEDMSPDRAAPAPEVISPDR
ncbi:MAG TPA: hypothetical protein VGB85_00975, partial [Nannocystis sp.]